MDLKGFGLSDEDLRQLGYRVGEDRPSAGEAPRPSAAAKRRDPAWRIWAASLVLVALAAWAGSSSRGWPGPTPATAPDTAFSSARALAQLVEISQRPHPTGSPDQDRVRAYLVSRLRSLGLDPAVQTATSYVSDSLITTAATVRNVVARVPGSASTGAVLLSAHYDAAPLSPGGSDDGMGVATVLETVRGLVAGPRLRNDVIVLFTDADELGLLGSRAFASDHSWMQDVAMVLTVEARGPTGPSVPFETGAENGRVVDALAALRPSPTVSSLSRALRHRAVESADADPLLLGRIPEVSLVSLGDGALRHQTRDTRDRVSERGLQQGGDQLLALSRAFGSIDLSQGGAAAPDEVYASIPWIGMVHYPLVWGVAGMLLLVAVWTLVGLILRGRRATRRGTLLGALWSVLVLVLSGAAARGLFVFLQRLHPEYGSLTTAFYHEGLVDAALVACGLACASIAYAVLRRFARQDELVFGGLAVPLVYVVWLAFVSPFASPAVQWPLALAMVAGAVVIVLGPARAATAWAWVPVVALSMMAVALTTPSLELLWTTLTLRSATEIGLAVGLALVALVPLMERLVRPRRWWTPLASVAAAGALVGISLLGGHDARPTPTTLLYLTDRPVNARPLPRQGPAAPGDTTRVRAMAGDWLTVRGPGETWARSWVGDPTPETRPGVLLLPDDDAYEVVGTGPDAELAPPSIRVLGSTFVDGRRRVELGLDPGLRAEMTGVYLPGDDRARLVGVGSAAWEDDEAPTRGLLHWGTPADGTLDFAVEVDDATAGLDVGVVEHSLRPREVLGSYFFQRPDSLVANASTFSDRVIQRTVLHVDLTATDSSASSGR